MKKRVALLVREGKGEALRVAVGLTLADDEITVFIMDQKLAADGGASANLETLHDLDVKIYSNNPEDGYGQMTTEEIAEALLEYDAVIPY